jgi:short-subunit dehydrogenase
VTTSGRGATTPARTAAVVTGGGRGIGLAFARRLAAAGHRVLITDIDETTARTAAESVPGATWIAQDVREPGSHAAVADRAAELGALRVWVNNAGVLIAGDSWKHEQPDIDRSFDVNVRGVIAGSHAAVRAMRSAGSILNIASTAALGPVPGLGIYGATKAAVLSFSTSLQGDLEHAGSAIRVHALCPDVVATDMVSDVVTDPGASILFAGRHLLEPDQVAAAGMALLETRHVARAVPRSAGAMARFTGLAPALGLRLTASARRSGERHQSERSGR